MFDPFRSVCEVQVIDISNTTTRESNIIYYFSFVANQYVIEYRAAGMKSKQTLTIYREYNKFEETKSNLTFIPAQLPNLYLYISPYLLSSYSRYLACMSETSIGPDLPKQYTIRASPLANPSLTPPSSDALAQLSLTSTSALNGANSKFYLPG